MRAFVVVWMVLALHLSAEEQQARRPVEKSVDGITYAVTITYSFRDATRKEHWRSCCKIMVEGFIKRADKKRGWQVKYVFRSDFIEYLTVAAKGDESVLEITHYIPKKRWQIEKSPYRIELSADEISVAVSQGGESCSIYEAHLLAQARKEIEKAKKILRVCRKLLGVRREELCLASIQEAFKGLNGLIEK